MEQFRFLKLAVICEIPFVFGFSLESGIVEKFRIKEIKFLDPNVFQKLEPAKEVEKVKEPFFEHVVFSS